MLKIEDKDLYKLAEKYNKEGKQALYSHLQKEYGIKNPTCTYKRMVTHTELGYSLEKDCFLLNKKITEKESGVFMTLDELCAPQKNNIVAPVEPQYTREAEMQKLIYELIGDRLLELSRYVSINASAKTIIIDNTSLARDGYNVITH